MPVNCNNGFRFKCFPQGNPNDYSYFIVNKEEERYEIRLSVDSQDIRWRNLRLNLDVAVIQAGSIDSDWCVDSSQDLITFVECKNLRGFPELVAGLEGMAFELQTNRLYPNSLLTLPIPACLFLSQSGHSIMFMDRRYQNYGKSLRIFDMLQPGSPSILIFIQTWF
jgi:hypothetical protein